MNLVSILKVFERVRMILSWISYDFSSWRHWSKSTIAHSRIIVNLPSEFFWSTNLVWNDVSWRSLCLIKKSSWHLLYRLRKVQNTAICQIITYQIFVGFWAMDYTMSHLLLMLICLARICIEFNSLSNDMFPSCKSRSICEISSKNWVHPKSINF